MAKRVKKKAATRKPKKAQVIEPLPDQAAASRESVELQRLCKGVAKVLADRVAMRGLSQAEQDTVSRFRDLANR